MNAREPLGVVGLGVMGGAMAVRLLRAGWPLRVFDVAPEARNRLAAEGAVACERPADVMAGAEVTLLSLPNAGIVREVVLGDGGLLAGARDGQVVVDLSSSVPETTVELGRRLGERGVALLDAPVSRGAAAARDGTLSIMVGGDAATLARCRPLLDELGTDVIHVGPLGAGHAAKALNNHLSATNFLGACEGLLIAARAGVDPARAVEAINTGSGASYLTEVRFPRHYLPRRFDSDFSLGLMRKDCAIAAGMAAAEGLPLLLGAVTTQLYQLAANRGLAAEDNTRMLELVEDLLHARLAAG